MKMKKAIAPYRFTSVSELHRVLGLSAPLHPLISIFDNTRISVKKADLPTTFSFDFYSISFKKRVKGRTGYGQSHYDFDDGTMTFVAPQQIVSTVRESEYFGISLLFHPELIRHYPLGTLIKRFGFFSYESNEALHLSDKEKETVLGIIGNLENELQQNIDDHSQDIVVSQIETLLNYSNRFYKRQFITRKAVNHDLLNRFDALLDVFFNSADPLTKGLPTVEMLAEALNLSPRYLSDMLRSLTGQGALQHIHEKLTEKAKDYLAGTAFSVAEIAYQLGFEHPQSFHKLFKKRTQISPLEYRQSFSKN
ncbi:helix-turn-helix transcriptional regulator [Mucilaginibacter sp. CAU 1740]|uniref:helix-turn-helix domain-containing protein n=1 Tax=Mucilaginibacter sp. CAU 1740 TaxID=3140365 RepID=UPI00325B7CE7